MTEENPLADSHRLLWEGLPETRKGPRPTLTLEQIVTTAIEIADAGGIDALSMRTLAGELEMSPMALYRYVPGKTELLDLMLDAVGSRRTDPTAEPDSVHSTADPVGSAAPPTGSPPGGDAGWREVLEDSAWEDRALYLHHRWLLQVNAARSPIGPTAIAEMEHLMTGLRQMPFTDQEKVMVMGLLDGYVSGTARQEILYEQAAVDSGLSDEEFWNYQVPVLVRAVESGNYPTLATMAEDSFDGGWEETFALGLRSLLDGLEAEVARREGRAEPAG